MKFFLIALTTLCAFWIQPCLAEPDQSGIPWESSSETVENLSRLNSQLVKAYENEDLPTLRALLSKNHVHNNVFGSRLDKETFLADIESGILEFLRYETPEIEWVIRGDVAIATGVIQADAVRNGQPVPANQFRFTRIYVKEESEWKVLLFHNTMMGKPSKP